MGSCDAAGKARHTIAAFQGDTGKPELGPHGQGLQPYPLTGPMCGQRDRTIKFLTLIQQGSWKGRWATHPCFPARHVDGVPRGHNSCPSRGEGHREPSLPSRAPPAGAQFGRGLPWPGTPGITDKLAYSGHTMTERKLRPCVSFRASLAWRTGRDWNQQS